VPDPCRGRQDCRGGWTAADLSIRPATRGGRRSRRRVWRKHHWGQCPRQTHRPHRRNNQEALYQVLPSLAPSPLRAVCSVDRGGDDPRASRESENLKTPRSARRMTPPGSTGANELTREARGPILTVTGRRGTYRATTRSAATIYHRLPAAERGWTSPSRRSRPGLHSWRSLSCPAPKVPGTRRWQSSCRLRNLTPCSWLGQGSTRRSM